MTAGPATVVLWQVGALAIVIAAVFAFAWLSRRISRTTVRGGAPLRVVGAASVGTRERVVVVEIGGTWLVVGVAPGQVEALHTMPRMDTTDAGGSAAPGFSSWLARSLEGRTRQGGGGT